MLLNNHPFFQKITLRPTKKDADKDMNQEMEMLQAENKILKDALAKSKEWNEALQKERDEAILIKSRLLEENINLALKLRHTTEDVKILLRDMFRLTFSFSDALNLLRNPIASSRDREDKMKILAFAQKAELLGSGSPSISSDKSINEACRVLYRHFMGK